MDGVISYKPKHSRKLIVMNTYTGRTTLKITKKALDKAFADAKWDVRKDKTMAFIAETDSCVYYEEHAKILIRDAGIARQDGNVEEYLEHLDNTIRHLILAKITYGAD